MSMVISPSQLGAGLTVVLKLPAFFLIEMWCLSSTETSLYQKLLHLAVPIASTVLVILPHTYLFHVYKFFAAVFVLVALHLHTQRVILSDTILDFNGFMINSGFLGMAGQCIGYLCGEKSEQNLFFMAHIIPMLTLYLGLPFSVHQWSLYLTDGVFCVYLTHNIKDSFLGAMRRIRTECTTWTLLVNVFGPIPVARTICDSILLTQQLSLFWLVSFVFKIFYYTTYTTDALVLTISKLDWVTFLTVCAGDCCKTYLGLISMCVAVSYMANYLCLLVQFYLHGWKGLLTSVDHSVGWVIGVLTFVLSVASGILIPSNTLKNMFVKGFIIKIISIFVTSNLLTSVYDLVDSAILSLSMIPTTKLFKHIQGLILYVFIMVFSLYMVYIIRQFVDIFVSIPVVILSLYTSLQVIASIIIYLLFVYDGVRSHPLENLDDIIYYIRSTVRFLDFAGSVILACNGIWLVKSGGLSWIQYPFFVLHCYSNVWERFQNGWKNFMLRRNAAKKVDALETATEEQIRNHDDVCSICLCPMSSAKITRCRHFFHQTCLKKWMYVGDSCPHCLQKL